MAKQKGLVSFVGTLDNVNFYYRKGKKVARMAGGGFNAERIKNSPNMANVRKNGSDFGHCSRVKRCFREALTPFMENLSDGELHGRMMKLFLKIKDFDRVHEKGEKRVYSGMKTQIGKQWMRDFDFTPFCDPNNILLNPTWNIDMGSGTVECDHWALSKKDFPKGANAIGLQVGRLHFDFHTMNHELELSDAVFLSLDSEPKPFQLSVAKPSLAGTEIIVLGIQFFSIYGEERFESLGLKGAGMRVLEVSNEP